jgi:hypothetical protein
MNYKSRFSGSVLAAFVAVMMLAVPVAGNAQETSSAVRGVVTDDSGNPVAGSTVTVRSEASGFSRSATSSNSGEYTIRNLPIGTYTISIMSRGHADQTSPGLAVNLGQTANVSFVLTASEDMEEIVVTGSAQQAVTFCFVRSRDTAERTCNQSQHHRRTAQRFTHLRRRISWRHQRHSVWWQEPALQQLDR